MYMSHVCRYLCSCEHFWAIALALLIIGKSRMIFYMCVYVFMYMCICVYAWIYVCRR
jgi:hypothetical protein